MNEFNEVVEPIGIRRLGKCEEGEEFQAEVQGLQREEEEVEKEEFKGTGFRQDESTTPTEAFGDDNIIAFGEMDVEEDEVDAPLRGIRGYKINECNDSCMSEEEKHNFPKPSEVGSLSDAFASKESGKDVLEIDKKVTRQEHRNQDEMNVPKLELRNEGNKICNIERSTKPITGVREMCYAIDVYLLNAEMPTLEEFSDIFKIDCVRMLELADIYVTLKEKVETLFDIIIQKAKKKNFFEKVNRTEKRKEEIKKYMNEHEEEDEIEFKIIIEE